jgi:hypothetical protein
MNMPERILHITLIFTLFFFRGITQENKSFDLKSYHLISSHELLDIASELSSEKYKGRLSGSPGYLDAAKWIAARLEKWGLKPGAGESGYFQWFPNSYTEVLNPGRVVLLKENGPNKVKRKRLGFPYDFFPGSNSASGRISGEVVYAGFGISAPELNYDDYGNTDVKDKIVLIEPGVPYVANDSNLLAWEPYSYHNYKFRHAREMGAKGLLYAGLTANPSVTWMDGFVYAHISEGIAEELFLGTGQKYAARKTLISGNMRPSSFPLGKRVVIRASTRHFPASVSCNVVGIIEGNDPVLKKEAILVGAHLDAVGSPGMVFPGALDNASGCADLLAAAQALARSEMKPARTVIFIFFGGEECGLIGSRHYVANPLWSAEKVQYMINLDMVGNGTGFHLSGGLSHPGIYSYFSVSNEKYIHRMLSSSETGISYGRPRTDGAIFEKAGYKTLGLWTTGTVKQVYYHQPLDNPDGLTPEIMEDAALLLYLGILSSANATDL